MDTAILTVARDPHRGFLLRWLGSWTLATALSSLLLGVVFVCEGRYHVYLGIYVFIGAVLSLPALAGLLHGIFMRPAFRRAPLWGTLTGGGIVIAALSIGVIAEQYRAAWWRIIGRVAGWLAQLCGFAGIPSVPMRVVFAALLFGCVLGATQSVALDFGWRSRLLWIVVSALAAVPAALWVYAWIDVEPVDHVFQEMVGLVPLAGEWRYLPVSILWAEVAALGFALPTGLLMQRLLRRHRRADDEALLRRFE